MESSRNDPVRAMPQVLDDPTLRDNRARLADLRRRQLSDLSVTHAAQLQDSAVEGTDRGSGRAVCSPARQHHRRLGVQNSATARRKQLLTRRIRTVGRGFRSVGERGSLQHPEEGSGCQPRHLPIDVAAGERGEHRRGPEVERRARGQSRRQATSPYRPSLPLNLSLGFLFGLVFSTCYILLRERNDASLRSPGAECQAPQRA